MMDCQFSCSGLVLLWKLQLVFQDIFSFQQPLFS